MLRSLTACSHRQLCMQLAFLIPTGFLRPENGRRNQWSSCLLIFIRINPIPLGQQVRYRAFPIDHFKSGPTGQRDSLCRLFMRAFLEANCKQFMVAGCFRNPIAVRRIRAKPGRKARLYRHLPQVIRELGGVKVSEKRKMWGETARTSGPNSPRKLPLQCLNDSGMP